MISNVNNQTGSAQSSLNLSLPSMPNQRYQARENIKAHIDTLIVRINTCVSYNFVLRERIQNSLSQLNLEIFRTWIDSNNKWEELKWKELTGIEQYAMPPSVSKTFENLKQSILAGKEGSDDLKYLEECLTDINVSQKGINQNKSLPEAIETQIQKLFELTSAQQMEGNDLKKKIEGIFSFMKENDQASPKLLKKILIEGFGKELQEGDAIDIAFKLLEKNPYQLSVAQLLINKMETLTDKVLCFMNERKINAVKIKKIERKGAPNLPSFCITGKDGGDVEVFVDITTAQITKVVWKEKVHENLSRFVKLLDSDEEKTVLITPEKNCHASMSQTLKPGKYLIKKQYNQPHEQVIFIPQEEHCQQAPIISRIYNENRDKWYLCRQEIIGDNNNNREIKQQETKQSGSLYDFFALFTIELEGISEYTLDAEKQNQIYITEIEPIHSKKIARDLKKESK